VLLSTGSRARVTNRACRGRSVQKKSWRADVALWLFGDTRGNESGAQSHLRRRRSAIRRCLGEREEKRLLQEREVCAGAAGGEQLSQLAGLGSVEGDGRLRAKAALEKE
jgi:hypothetical protein